MYFLLHSSGLTFRAGGRKEKERSIRYRGSVRSTLARRDIVIIFWRDTTRESGALRCFVSSSRDLWWNFIFIRSIYRNRTSTHIRDSDTTRTPLPWFHPRTNLTPRWIVALGSGNRLRLNEFNEFFSVDRSVIGDLVAHGISTDTILLSTN